MVLDAPDRVETEGFREGGEAKLIRIDLTVGDLVLRILEDRRHSQKHAFASV